MRSSHLELEAEAEAEAGVEEPRMLGVCLALAYCEPVDGEVAFAQSVAGSALKSGSRWMDSLHSLRSHSLALKKQSLEA